MLNGSRNTFIFQFFELSPYEYFDYKSFTHKTHKDINIIDEKPGNYDTQNIFIDNTFKRKTVQRYLDEKRFNYFLINIQTF